MRHALPRTQSFGVTLQLSTVCAQEAEERPVGCTDKIRVQTVTLKEEEEVGLCSPLQSAAVVRQEAGRRCNRLRPLVYAWQPGRGLRRDTSCCHETLQLAT